MKDRNTINRGRKFDQVRDGASAVFLRDGYAAACVDDIARAARVSKATLYSYFPDKKLMFQDVFEAAMTSAFATAPFDIDRKGPASPGLEHTLRQLGDWLLIPVVLQLHRVALTEAGRFPALARSYRARRDRAVLVPLSAQIDIWASRGDIQVSDPALLARQIFHLFASEVQQTALLGDAEQMAPDDIATLARSTARLVLRACSVSDRASVNA
ncbi:MAG: TetR/AcrR family transcriptional regulator [Paracoccus sp. (in: a-proteobacteria)]